MNTTENELAELKRLLAAFGAATQRLADRVDRMEQRQAVMGASIRETGDTPPPRRRFRPLDLSNRIQG